MLKDLETSNVLSGARAVDIKALHSVLTGNLQGTTMGQKQMIDEEIQRSEKTNLLGTYFI